MFDRFPISSGCVLAALMLTGCQTGGMGNSWDNRYDSGGSSGANPYAECKSERDEFGMRYYRCNAPNGGTCRSERSRDGVRYYICTEPSSSGSSGSSGSFLGGNSGSCRSERDQNGRRYYICDEPNGMNCKSERSGQGVRYYICRP